MYDQGGYCLDEIAYLELAEAVMQQQPPKKGIGYQDYFVRLLPLGSDQRLAQATEARLFELSFGDKPEDRAAVWSPYEDKSFALVILSVDADHLGLGYRCMGVMRVIAGSGPSDFKSLVQMSDPEHWGDERPLSLIRSRIGSNQAWTSVWDIATMAIHPDVVQQSRGAGRKVILALLHSLYQQIVRHEMDYLLGILASDVYRGLDDLGLGLIPLGDSRGYYRVESRPFLLEVARLPGTLIRPRMSNILLRGEGLDGYDIQV